MKKSCLFIIIYGLIIVSCNREKIIEIPDYFPNPNPEKFNKITKEQIALGFNLFFDNRLSSTDKISCKSCHIPALAFTDGVEKGVGIEGRHSRNNSSTLMNIAFSPTFMFDMRANKLELQPMLPIHDSNEMNMTLPKILEKLKDDEEIQSLSKKAYGTELTADIITKSLAAYMSSLISSTSRYDSFLKTDDKKIFTAAELRGKNLFFSKGKCFSCHVSPLMTDFDHRDLNIEPRGSANIGKEGATLDSNDRYRFKTPTLRNIAITNPYFHTGAIPTLKEALVYHTSPDRKTRDFDPPVLTEKELADIEAFLHTFTDKRYQ